ncbi:MAG: septum formation initiator family protein [Candidatus Theseobacter exili]|nr:septum formation initiator family protein [Candidatus Theseobacter exili]
MKRFTSLATWLVLFAFGVLIVIYFYWPNFVKLHRLSKREQTLRTEIGRLENENQRLRDRIFALEHDPVYVEKVARDDLGLSRPDEVIYKFNEKELK